MTIIAEVCSCLPGCTADGGLHIYAVGCQFCSVS